MEPTGPLGDLASEEDEADAFMRDERVLQARQDRQERKVYAKRIFVLVAVWLSAIVVLLLLQGLLGLHGRFQLADAILIAVATSTTASVAVLLVVVARSLFPNT